MAKGRLAPGDIGSLFLAGSFAVLAANLTMVVAAIDSDRTNRALLMFVWPGLYSAYVLTGGSNASSGQEAIAPYLAAAINSFLYFIAIVAMRLIWRQLTSESNRSIDRSAEQGGSDDCR
jgi:lipopolysaccharide export LptBFGC system permease protein LptF